MTTINPCKVQDKVVIVTGGASGIGEATARLLAEHGARAVVIADIQPVKGQQLAQSIGIHRSKYIHCDVADEIQVQSLIESTVQSYGKLDIMFCNAGVVCTSSAQTVLDLDLSACDKLFAVNVRGVAASVKHAARVMVEGGVKGSSIICTASVAAVIGGARMTDYIMSKCAVVGLVKAASSQLGPHGIRVNCVSPGPVVTPLLCESFGMEAAEAEKAFESRCFLEGKLRVEDVANAVLFLASDESRFVSGHNLVLDGGGFKFS